MVPFQALQMVGHTVHASARTRRGQVIRTAVHDFEGIRPTARSAAQLQLECRFRQGCGGQLRCPSLPGGRAPEYLRLDQSVLAMIRHFVEAAKPIAALCHGAQLLTAAGAVRGRSLSAYPACGPKSRPRGKYVAVDDGSPRGREPGIRPLGLRTLLGWPNSSKSWKARLPTLTPVR